jgi:pimeloyl-ACP methyl ester carboxylesterase
MADWYAGLLEALGVSSATIIGHSQGCLVGLEMAKRYPEKVTKLCLIAGALAIPVNDALLDMAMNNPPAAYQAMVNWAHANDSHLYAHSWPGQTHIEFGTAVMESNDNQALFADLSACNQYHDGPDAAAAIMCPSLAILASHDKMTPAKAGKKMADALENCTLQIIEDAGHFLPSERPYEVNKHLRAFLA